uniref:FCH domain-containing protein n=1 Tax=Anolis carolinensis TaxID=28377 RepID=A0A803TPB1_ANOCA
MAVRNVLVTGCSSGIGLALAVRLARDELKRFRVIATMRNLAKRQALEMQAGPVLEKTLEIKELDVTSEESIRHCVDSIPQRRVDVLVNNAGLGMIGPVESQSLTSMQHLFDANFFGLVRLVKEVFPDMKKRKQGHVVVMSSVLGLQGLLFNDIYSASKFAVEGFCESLALQALKFGVNISLIEPGPVITEFERKLYEEAANMDLSGLDKETLDIFQGFYMAYSKEVFTALGQSPEEVAEDQFDIVERHTQWGLDLMDKYVKFVKERTEIEQSYAKQLRNLVKKHLPKRTTREDPESKHLKRPEAAPWWRE